MNDTDLPFPVAPFSAAELSQPAIVDQGVTDRFLLRVARHKLGSLAEMQRAFDRATKYGVWAATACDYKLFDGMTDLIDPRGEGSGFGEPFDDSPWTAKACAELINKIVDSAGVPRVRDRVGGRMEGSDSTSIRGDPPPSAA